MRGISKNDLSKNILKNTTELRGIMDQLNADLKSGSIDSGDASAIKKDIDVALNEIKDQVKLLKQGMSKRNSFSLFGLRASRHKDINLTLAKIGVLLGKGDDQALEPGRYDKKELKLKNTIIVGQTGSAFELLGHNDKKGVIGKGGMGKVKYARAMDGTLVCVKKVSLSESKGEKTEDGRSKMTSKNFIAEAKTQCKLGIDNPQILGGIDYLVTTDSRGEDIGYIFSPLKEGAQDGFDLFMGNRYKNLSNGTLSDDKINDMSYQFLSGISSMHESGLAHADIKPENILIDSQGTLQIMDFGFTSDINSLENSSKGTPDYLSPELWISAVNGGGESNKSLNDSWAAGNTLFAMKTGDVLVTANDMKQMLRESSQAKPGERKLVLYKKIDTLVNKRLAENEIRRKSPLGQAIKGLLAADLSKRITVTAAKEYLKPNQ